MSCAISPVSMAHQWRNRFAPLTKVALREKLMAQWRAIAFPPMAQLWRNGAFSRGLKTGEHSTASSVRIDTTAEPFAPFIYPRRIAALIAVPIGPAG